MPVPALKSLIDKSDSNKTLDDAERYWNEAKEQAKEKGLSGENYWKYVMGIVKKRLGISNNSYIKIVKFALKK